jgi:hypothetical protein
MSARFILTLFIPVLTSCVSYEREEASPQSVADTVAARTSGVLSIDAAIQLALDQNPELRALEARARGAAAATTVALPTQGEWRGRNEAVGIMLDPIALLGIGPRGAAISAAEAQHVEAMQALAVGRWRVIAAIVEEFLIDDALHNLSVVDLELEANAFVTAGLASPLAASQLRAAQAKALSEQVELDRARHDSEARLRQLLGLPRSASITMQGMPDDWLLQPSGSDPELLSRPDLALSTAKFEVADAKFRKAVAEQYPSFQIGPNFSLRGDPLRGMGMLRIPIGMHGHAEAARESREAARLDLESAFLQARREASLNEENLLAASTLSEATGSALQASATAFEAARGAIEVEVDAFSDFANTARMVMRDTSEHRRASVANARATIRRAVAFGWPCTQLLAGDQQ